MDTFMKYKVLFFSKHKLHSKFLSWVVLPYAVLSEAQLLFEPLFFALIWTYTFITGDYLSVGLSSLFIAFCFLAGTVFGDKETNKAYFFLFPSFWILFYLLVAVEFLSLVKSVELVLSNQDVVWQKWNRVGIKSQWAAEKDSFEKKNKISLEGALA
jgi:hypothetical protein